MMSTQLDVSEAEQLRALTGDAVPIPRMENEPGREYVTRLWRTCPFCHVRRINLADALLHQSCCKRRPPDDPVWPTEEDEKAGVVPV